MTEATIPGAGPPLRTAPRLGFPVAAVAFGTSPLGSMPLTYGYDVGEERAAATLAAILAVPGVLVDTSRNYGDGRSEARIGAALRATGGLPAGARLATKIDRDMATGRFDGDRARRSAEESLAALGVSQVDLLHLHDPEYGRDLAEITGRGGAIETLLRMRDEGICRRIGLAMGRLPLLRTLLAAHDWDAVLTHNRWTLLNREADAMFDEAHARGIAVLNAAPYAGGVLAKGSDRVGRVTYQDATEATLAPVRAVEAVCARHGVPVGAAALQFAFRDPRVTATVLGVSRPERVAETLDWARWPIPDDAWADLLALPYSVADPEADRPYNPG